MVKLPERIEKCRRRYADTVPEIDAERALIITQAYKKTEAQPAVIRRAEALKRIASEMTIRIEEGELIIGNIAKNYRGTALFPETDLTFFFDELRDGTFEKRDASSERFLITEEVKQQAFTIEEYWKGIRLTDVVGGAMPDEVNEVMGGGVLTFKSPEMVVGAVGHYCGNFERVIDKGFKTIREEAQAHIDAVMGKMNGENASKYLFWKAVIITCDAVRIYAGRYAALAREKAAVETDEKQKALYLRIADTCDWVPENPARTFVEAVQAAWFYQMLLMIESNGVSISMGRFDQYTGKLYEMQRKAGAVTYEECLEVVESLWIKICELSKLKNINYSRNFGAYTMGIHVTCAGQTKDGRDASNDVTLMMLQASRDLSLPQPPVSVRVHNGTPEKIWKAAIECTKKVGGIPTFQNDNIIIPQMLRRGLSLEEARDYTIIGCVEPSGHGNDFSCCGGTGTATFFNLPQCLVLAMNNGVNPKTGVQAGPKTGYFRDFKVFEDFRTAYEAQVHHFIDWYATVANLWEISVREIQPLPLLSATMEGCVESGNDVMYGGAKYNNMGIAAVGIANVADGLAAIKKFVFDDKTCTSEEYFDNMLENWEGNEPMRQRIINDVPKYGNDEAYVDELARWAAGVFLKYMNTRRGVRCNFSGGLWPVSAHISMGANTLATPDGRKAGGALSDGISPSQALDKNGPVAIIKSCSALDQNDAFNGTLLNMKIHPFSLQGDGGQKKLRELVQTYFDLGGMHVQFNIISSETLRAAQNNPEEYQNLVIRIAGFSAYFVQLYKELQDDLIRRTDIMA